MACKDLNYQDFCTQIYQYAPACEKINKNNAPSSSFLLNNNLEASLVLQMFELGHLFLENNMIKFYNQGKCMYPCIRPKDALHLESRNAGGIQVGDIAVYRRFNRLFAHRTIDKGSKDGHDYIVTRPDTARLGNDGPSFDKDILGIVVRIERNGVLIDTKPKEYSLIVKLFLDIDIYFRGLGEYYWNRLAYLHSYLQQYKFYRAACPCLVAVRSARDAR